MKKALIGSISFVVLAVLATLTFYYYNDQEQQFNITYIVTTGGYIDGETNQKVANTVTTYYWVDGSKILMEKPSNITYAIWYFYDESGVYGFQYEGTNYIFEKNILGDVTRIFNMSTGTFVGEYTYDAWGNILSQTNNTVTNANPFRYRSYYYDQETGFYYLNSRYYDPATGRFINADDPTTLFATASIAGGANLFAYCLNNPIAYADDSGESILLTLSIAFIVGAVIAGGVSAGVQLVTEGSIDWGVVGIDALFGGANGLLIVSGIGAIGQMALGGLISMENYMAVAGYRGDEIIQAGMMISFGIGFIAGAIRGDGLMKGKFNMVNGMEKQVINAFKSNGFSVGVKTFNQTLGRYFQQRAIMQLIQSGTYQFLGKTTTYWGKKVVGINALYGG
jgi:RHS repeat-associated protein